MYSQQWLFLTLGASFLYSWLFPLLYRNFEKSMQSHLSTTGLNSRVNGILPRKRSHGPLCLVGDCCAFFLQPQHFRFHSEVWSPLAVAFRGSWWTQVYFHYCTGRHSVFLAPFVDAFFSPANNSCLFIKRQMAAVICTYVWAYYFVPLICMSVFVLVLFFLQWLCNRSWNLVW